MQTSPELLDDSISYRRISPVALVALLLGLAAPLVFVSPFFYLIAAAAVGVGLLALGGIRRADGALTGQLFARIGIALALLCSAAAMVRGSVRDALLQRQAVEAADGWLHLLAQGRVKDARRLITADAAAGFLPSPGMGQPPVPEEDREAIVLDRLRSDRLTRTLAAAKSIEFRSVDPPVIEGRSTGVGVAFALAEGTGTPREVKLQVARYPGYEVEGRAWRIDRWTFAEDQ